MMTAFKSFHFYQQRGIATILILILVGFATLGAVTGVIIQVRSTQEQGMALHASTQSQAKAWAGVEVVRQYLFGLQGADKWDDLTTAIAGASTNPVNIDISTMTGLTAAVVDYKSVSGTEYITVNIAAVTGANTKAASSSTVQVVYSYAEATTSAPPSKNVLVFNDSLTLEGNVELINNSAESYNLNVTGNLVARSNIIGFDIL